MRFSTFTSGALVALTLSACAPVELPAMADFMPAMGWDHRPEASEWTVSTMSAVAAKDDTLAKVVPQDIAVFCPGYPEASLFDRRAFWVGLLSATAKHESTWNPRASGGGGSYIGLMQIAPATARNYDCDATSTAALKDGTANLECAVEIMATQVGRDGVVAGNGNRGIGRDWGPFKSSKKRAEIAGWTSQQTYCQG